jgi:hypothetical protein
MAEFPKSGVVALSKAEVGKNEGRKLIVVLQQASLETVKTKKVGGMYDKVPLLAFYHTSSPCRDSNC